jgi:enolase
LLLPPPKGSGFPQAVVFMKMAKKDYGTSLLQDVKGSQGRYIDPVDVDKEVAQGEFSKKEKTKENKRHSASKKQASILIYKELFEKYRVIAKDEYNASFTWLTLMALKEFCKNHEYNLDDIEV